MKKVIRKEFLRIRGCSRILTEECEGSIREMTQVKRSVEALHGREFIVDTSKR